MKFEGAIQDNSQNNSYLQMNNGAEGLTPHFQETFTLLMPKRNHNEQISPVR